MTQCLITRNVFFQLDKKWAESPKLRPLIPLAALVAIAVLPVLLLGDLARWAYFSARNIPSADHHYFYSTEIFTKYHEQLREYVRGELKDHPELKDLEIVQWIQGPVQDRRAFYQGFVLRLREAVSNEKRFSDLKNSFLKEGDSSSGKEAVLRPLGIDSSAYPPMNGRDCASSSLFTERLCNWVYTGPSLLPVMTKWMRSHVPSTDAEQIGTLHPQLSSQAKFQGEIFQDYRPYDPQLLGDAPSFLFEVGNTKVIRTPAVTKDERRSYFGHLTKAAIVEEFRGFLNHCRRTNKTHLYVNLMEPRGSEKVRTDAIEELESEVFHLVTLSKDCPFYHQGASFAQLNDATEFKKTFLDQMFSMPAYHWPKGWDRKETQKLCGEAIEKVHANHFHGFATLDREQRRNFIELAYTEIIESMIHKHNPTTCNVSCRSCVDRGAANLTLLYAQTQPSREALIAIAMAPAMLAQSRTMFPCRLKRLVGALPYIERLK